MSYRQVMAVMVATCLAGCTWVALFLWMVFR